VDVLRLVVRTSALSVGCGAVLGVIASVVAGRVLAHVVDGGYAEVMLPLLSGLLVLAVAALIASLIPAARATRIEPLEALRYE
jgi:ABC-type antimicrobial peptide transport system permease subunit